MMNDPPFYPMPIAYKKIKPMWRPMHPPFWSGEMPSRAEFAYALEVFELLDEESQEWWGGQDTRKSLKEAANGE